jgi:microcystin-dependent protein
LNNYIIALSTNDTVCVGVTVPTITLPDGFVDSFYTYSTNVYGSAPFTLSNFVKPDWMTISASGNTLTFSGTPDEFEDDIPISFDIENACGTDDVSITLNILEMTAGTILMWGGSPASPPSGWLTCDGATASRTTYAGLFAVVGTTYGVGDGSTTFTLPNLKQRVPAGYDAVTSGYNTLGGTGGTGTATLTDQQIAHRHTYELYRPGTGGVDGDDGPQNFGYDTTNTSEIGDADIARDPIDTRDKYIVFSFIIKT